MKTEVSQAHRRELLRFLLTKTAAVRSGIKPAELLRVRHCYKSKNSDGFQFCLYRSDILEILNLHYLELQNTQESSLILFYHPQTLRQTLRQEDNLAILRACNYPETADMTELLAHLADRFSREKIPHEIGVFIGYPAKDVDGFIRKLPKTPVHHGIWTVFGEAAESLAKMELYRSVESLADRMLDACEDLQTFYHNITNINAIERKITNG